MIGGMTLIVVVGRGRARTAAQAGWRRGWRRATAFHAFVARDLGALDVLVDLEGRDAVAVLGADVLVDADDAALAAVDLALEVVGGACAISRCG
jgi:hypothetical protein